MPVPHCHVKVSEGWTPEYTLQKQVVAVRSASKCPVIEASLGLSLSQKSTRGGDCEGFSPRVTFSFCIVMVGIVPCRQKRWHSLPVPMEWLYLRRCYVVNTPVQKFVTFSIFSTIFLHCPYFQYSMYLRVCWRDSLCLYHQWQKPRLVWNYMTSNWCCSWVLRL